MSNKVLFIVLFGAAATAIAQEFRLARYTIDSGGVIRGSGGSFQISATIGQPDAASSTGGGFRLDGGFWFQLAPGDCDQDGAVNLDDHSMLTHCLSGPSAAVLGGCECYDVDRDGHTDLYDLATISNSTGG